MCSSYSTYYGASADDCARVEQDGGTYTACVDEQTLNAIDEICAPLRRRGTSAPADAVVNGTATTDRNPCFLLKARHKRRPEPE